MVCGVALVVWGRLRARVEGCVGDSKIIKRFSRYPTPRWSACLAWLLASAVHRLSLARRLSTPLHGSAILCSPRARDHSGIKFEFEFDSELGLDLI